MIFRVIIFFLSLTTYIFAYDLNGDGVVDLEDFSIIADSYCGTYADDGDDDTAGCDSDFDFSDFCGFLDYFDNPNYVLEQFLEIDWTHFNSANVPFLQKHFYQLLCMSDISHQTFYQLADSLCLSLYDVPVLTPGDYSLCYKDSGCYPGFFYYNSPTSYQVMDFDPRGVKFTFGDVYYNDHVTSILQFYTNYQGVDVNHTWCYKIDVRIFSGLSIPVTVFNKVWHDGTFDFWYYMETDAFIVLAKFTSYGCNYVGQPNGVVDTGYSLFLMPVPFVMGYSSVSSWDNAVPTNMSYDDYRDYIEYYRSAKPWYITSATDSVRTFTGRYKFSPGTFGTDGINEYKVLDDFVGGSQSIFLYSEVESGPSFLCGQNIYPKHKAESYGTAVRKWFIERDKLLDPLFSDIDNSRIYYWNYQDYYFYNLIYTNNALLTDDRYFTSSVSDNLLGDTWLGFGISELSSVSSPSNYNVTLPFGVSGVIDDVSFDLMNLPVDISTFQIVFKLILSLFVTLFFCQRVFYVLCEQKGDYSDEDDYDLT